MYLDFNFFIVQVGEISVYGTLRTRKKLEIFILRLYFARTSLKIKFRVYIRAKKIKLFFLKRLISYEFFCLFSSPPRQNGGSPPPFPARSLPSLKTDRVFALKPQLPPPKRFNRGRTFHEMPKKRVF